MHILVTLPTGDIRDSFFPPDVCEKMQALGAVTMNPGDRDYSAEQLMQQVAEADVCLTGWGTHEFTPEILEHAGHLRVIAHTGGSVGNIVNPQVYARKIEVLSGNEMYAESVAESVIAYALCSLRKLVRYTNELQTMGWSQPGWDNAGLIGKTVGLVGFGAVARHTARLLQGFHPRLMICAGHVTQEEAAGYGAEKAELEEIFSTCDVISIHLAQCPETHHIIDRHLLKQMRDGALLINTARGSIVDESALAAELQTGRICAALDVYETEPLPLESKLRGLPNALLIPHMGGPTIDRRAAVTRELLRILPAALRHEKTALTISPEAAARMTRE